VFDKNRDGHVDENELKQTMKDLGMTLSGSDISAMMKKAGCKIAGRIYYEGLLS
jgi:Ca2+-binding EF-hand superfamily protein